MKVTLKKDNNVPHESERDFIVTVRNVEYYVRLHQDIEDGGYWAECPALSGCASQGDTIEEALEMIEDAIEGHLEILDEDAGLLKE